MTNINVGGLNFLNRYDLKKAIQKSRPGDTIVLRKNLSASDKVGPLRIEHDITFDGQGKKISVYHDCPLLISNSSCHLTFSNLTIFIQKKANFLFLGELFKGSVTFRNVKVEFSKRSDARDFYSPIHANGSDFTITFDHFYSDYLRLMAQNITILNSEIGHLSWGKSQLYASQFDIQSSCLSNLTLKSMYSDQHANLQSHILTSQGNLNLEEVDGEIHQLTFIPYLDHQSDNFTDKESYLKSFANSVYQLDQVIYLVLSRCGTGEKGKSFLLSQISYPKKNCRFFKTCPLIVDESEIKLVDSTLEFNALKGLLSHSTVRFENVIDKNEWTVKEATLSNLNSQSLLFAENHVVSNQTALDEIKTFIGLKNVKKQINNLISSAKMNALRIQRGLGVTSGFSMHMIFGGSAGTGKTSIAKLFGRALYESGVLPTNRFVFASEPDLVAGYVGQTAQKTKDLVLSAKGGVLFIDEAYALTPDGQNSFKQEAIDQLVALSDELRNDTVIILAGYSQPMKKFLQANEGLSSRFKNWIEFPDYSLEDLIQILDLDLQKQFVHLTEEDQKVLVDSFLFIYKHLTQDGQTPLQGNGRTIRNYVQDLIQARDVRINQRGAEQLSDEELQQVTAEDIHQVESHYLHSVH